MGDSEGNHKAEVIQVRDTDTFGDSRSRSNIEESREAVSDSPPFADSEGPSSKMAGHLVPLFDDTRAETVPILVVLGEGRT